MKRTAEAIRERTNDWLRPARPPADRLVASLLVRCQRTRRDIEVPLGDAEVLEDLLLIFVRDAISRSRSLLVKTENTRLSVSMRRDRLNTSVPFSVIPASILDRPEVVSLVMRPSASMRLSISVTEWSSRRRRREISTGVALPPLLSMT